MTNENIISSTQLSNNDFLAFNTHAIESADNVVTEDFKAQVPTYTEAVAKFKNYISSVAEKEARKEASDAGIERDELFAKFRNFVKSLRHFPDAKVKSLASTVWDVVKDFNSNATTSRSAVTAMTSQTITKVKELGASESYAEAYKSSGLETWVTSLEEANDKFLAAFDAKVSEREIREQETNLALRENCMKAFNVLRNYAQYMAIAKGDASCKKFVRDMEILAKSYRSLYKMRANRNAESTEQGKAADQNATQAKTTETQEVKTVAA